MESHRRGELTEAIVIAELKRQEIPVSTPFGDNERYDLIVETPDSRLLRVQVKTGWLTDHGVIKIKGKSQHTNSSGHVYKSYQGDVDYFLAYCYETEEVYWIPESEIGGEISLRVESPEQHHHTINWAEDYELDRCWPPESDQEPGIAESRRSPTVRKVVDYLRTRGVTVAATPDDSTDFDVLAESQGGEFVRLRVRTAYLDDGRIRHTPDQIDNQPDFLAIYVGELDELYLVPGDEYGSSISLRIEEPDQPDASINWAEDYAFDARWPPGN